MAATAYRAIALFVVLAMLPAALRAEDAAVARFQPRTYTSPLGGSLPYRLFVPRALDPGRKYPLVLFLHGAGERGTDNARQVRDIAAWSTAEAQAKHPCFIVAPQCPNWREVFQVYGSNTDLAVTTYRTYAGSEKQWRHFKISPAAQVSGRVSSLFFINDDAGRDARIESLFRNVKVYEAGHPSPRAIDFRKTTVTPYAGGGRGNNPAIADSGATLHLVGDTRLKVPLPYTVTKSTVIEFDFQSSAQGNLHGIGLDDDDQIFENCWVQVDWGDPSHTMPKQPSMPLRCVMEMLPDLEKEFPAIDPRRLYAVGLSMGGFGVWDLLARRPDWFAAATPICGGADLSTAPTVAPIPVWVFHGGGDGTVQPQRSRSMVAALSDVGGEPRYTEYPGVGHDLWTRALADPELADWLFAQRRATTRPPAPGDLRATYTGATRVDLTWSPVHDEECRIKEYIVLRDGGEIGVTATNRFSDTELAAGEVHSYTVIAMNAGWFKSPPSRQAWAKIPVDTTALHVTAADAQGSPTRVEVQFDKPVDPRRASDAANYALDRGVTVSGAILLPDLQTVRLETAALAPHTEYTVSVTGVTDRAEKPNGLAGPARVKFTYDPCLAAHWRLDEGEGQFSGDATGNGNNVNGNIITFHAVDWAPGRWGRALNFDGGGSHFAWTVQSPSLDLVEGVTVSLWIKKGVGQYGRQVIIAKSNYYDHRTQFLLDFDESHRVRAIVGTLGSAEAVVLGGRIDAREWHHLALTYGSKTLELFIDGQSQGKAMGGGTLMSVSEPVTIGAGHQGRDPLHATIDEIRIYNRALSPDQIRALATATSE